MLYYIFYLNLSFKTDFDFNNFFYIKYSGGYSSIGRPNASRLPSPNSVSSPRSPNPEVDSPSSRIPSGIRPPSSTSMIRPPSTGSSPWMFGHHKNARVVGDKVRMA